MEAGMECPFRRPPGLRLNVTGLLPYPQSRPSLRPVLRRSCLPSFLPPAPSLVSAVIQSRAQRGCAIASEMSKRSEGPSAARVCERQRDVEAPVSGCSVDAQWMLSGCLVDA